MKVTDTKTLELTFHKTCDGRPSHSCECLTKNANSDSFMQLPYSHKHQAFNVYDSFKRADSAMECTWWAELPSGECLPDEDSMCDASETPSKAGVCIDEPDSLYDKFVDMLPLDAAFVDAVARIADAFHTFAASESARAVIAEIQRISDTAAEAEKIAEAQAMDEPTGLVDLDTWNVMHVLSSELDPGNSTSYLCFGPVGFSKGDHVIFKVRVPDVGPAHICTKTGKIVDEKTTVCNSTVINGITCDYISDDASFCASDEKLRRCLGKTYSWHLDRQS